jgi:hypothetical protein
METFCDDETEEALIDLDQDTIARLARFGRAVGKHPRVLAGELLRDLLADPDFWNAAARRH